MEEFRFIQSRPGKEPTPILVVISSDAYRSCVQRTLFGSEWQVSCTCTCKQARTMLSRTMVEVVICERDLPDGSWKDILAELSALPVPPRLIVVARHADEALWAEVLNLGGYDVLPEPLAERELLWSVTMASGHGGEVTYSGRQRTA